MNKEQVPVTQADIDRATMWWLINHEGEPPANLVASYARHRSASTPPTPAASQSGGEALRLVVTAVLPFLESYLRGMENMDREVLGRPGTNAALNAVIEKCRAALSATPPSGTPADTRSTEGVEDDEPSLALSVLNDAIRLEGWPGDARKRFHENDLPVILRAMVQYGDERAALPPSSPATAADIPEGMVPWHGGDSEPDDWDGGPVLWRNCAIAPPLRQDGPVRWAHTDPYSRGHDFDIIAYTPASSNTPDQSDEAGE